MTQSRFDDDELKEIFAYFFFFSGGKIEIDRMLLSGFGSGFEGLLERSEM